MLNATLIKRIEITKELLIVWVKPDAGVPEFLPGQYVALGLDGAAPRPPDAPPEHETHAAGKLIKRAYSIGSPPSQREYLEFYIAVVPTGALTSRLMMLKEGDRLFSAPKITGTFTLKDVPAEHNLILISTGTGIAPFMSMLRTPETWKAGRSITIIHGVRYESDFAYAEELRACEARHKSFRYLPIVSRAKEEWKGARGHAQKFILDGAVKLNAQRDHVFLCGNPAMVGDIEKLLAPMGYKEHSKREPSGTLHLEKYW